MSRGRPALRRRAVLAFVRNTEADRGHAPTYGEICQALGIRTRCEVSRIINSLERAGDIRRVGAGSVRPTFANSSWRGMTAT